jgi:hypothetical protein
MVDDVHILDEEKSPETALVWTMWCGDQCCVFDGTIVPEGFDFFLEQNASKATCSRCRRSFIQGKSGETVSVVVAGASA